MTVGQQIVIGITLTAFGINIAVLTYSAKLLDTVVKTLENIDVTR